LLRSSGAVVFKDLAGYWMFGSAAFILAALQHRWLLYHSPDDWCGPRSPDDAY